MRAAAIKAVVPSKKIWNAVGILSNFSAHSLQLITAVTDEH